MNISTGSFDARAGTLNLTNAGGGLTVNSGAFTLLGTAIVIAGDYDINGGTNDLNAGSISFVNMLKLGGGDISVGNSTITSTGTVTVNAGSFIVDGAAGVYNFGSITVGPTGTWNVTAAYSPTISGNLVNNGSFTGCNGLGCVYTFTNNPGSISGSGALTNMATISVSNALSNTNTGGLNITQGLTGAGSFTNGTNGRFVYGGTDANFSLAGTFTTSATGNRVTYNRATNDQLIRPTVGNVYYNLESNKATGGNLTMSQDITVNNELTLTEGDVILGTQNLIIASAASITGAKQASYVNATGTGRLRKMTSSTGSFTAPVGGDFLSPITVNLTAAGALNGTTFIEFGITDAVHPQRNRDNTGDVPAGDDNGVGKPAAVDFLDVYWTVGGNITSPVYDATYVYDASDFTQTTESNMVGALYRDIGGTLDWLPTGTVNASNNTVTFGGAIAFGDFYAMDDTMERLPIVLLSFTAKTLISAIELNWQTVAEENNAFFTIERSANGVNFSPILFTEGGGTSNDLLTYQAVDNEPILGRSYYRLKQTDFNGQFEYSEIISVIFEGSDRFSFGLLNNPVAQGEPIAIWKTSSLEGMNPMYALRNLQGQLVYSAELPQVQQNSIEINKTSNLGPGIYLLTIRYLGQSKTVKVLVR
jgi:hypothetical protein